ncbi:MAG TPA: hypothetical protein VGD37_25330 [Kofleriaceae bacterium]
MPQPLFSRKSARPSPSKSPTPRTCSVPPEFQPPSQVPAVTVVYGVSHAVASARVMASAAWLAARFARRPGERALLAGALR